MALSEIDKSQLLQRAERGQLHESDLENPDAVVYLTARLFNGQDFVVTTNDTLANMPTKQKKEIDEEIGALLNVKGIGPMTASQAYLQASLFAATIERKRRIPL